MTAPTWMALPPEIHATLLSSGPGPGPLLASATAWHGLAGEYAAAAAELAELLAVVTIDAWRGETAEQYLAAHLPYLAWLQRAGADSAEIAARQRAAAGAYAVALSSMPTLPELAANHTVHGALLATNFFGINTIPIAFNEADYARMWIQAATTMSTYQAGAAAAVAAAPHTASPAPILKSPAAQQSDDPLGWAALLRQLEDFEGADNLLQLIWPGNPFTPYPPGTDLGSALSDAWTSFYQGLFLYDPQTLAFAHSPAQLIATLLLAAVQVVTHRLFDLMQIIYNFPQLLTAVAPLMAAQAGGLAGLTGLTGLAGVTAPATAPVTVPAGAAQSSPLVQGIPAVPSTPVATSPAVAAPAPAVPASPPPTPPPPAVGTEVLGYLVGGGPETGFGSGARSRTSAPLDDPVSNPVPAPTAATPVPARRRRRARLGEHARGYRYEFADVTPDADGPADATAPSDRGAGPLGVTGTTTGCASGLVTREGRRLSGQPMLPTSWTGG